MIYVVTNPDRGWDCVCGVYDAQSENEVKKIYCEETATTIEEFEENYIVHGPHNISK